MTPEEALGRLAVEVGSPRAAEVAEMRRALADLAWYRAQYPKVREAATQVREDVAALRREYDAHARRCPEGWR